MTNAITIERDEWMYVWTDSAEKARKFFGIPADTEVHRTADQGVTWTTMDIPGDADGNLNPGGQVVKNFSLLADATNSNIVYAGGDRQTDALPNASGAERKYDAYGTA